MSGDVGVLLTVARRRCSRARALAQRAQDTAAYTIGRTCEFVPKGTAAHHTDLVRCLSHAIDDPSSRVAAQACYAIHYLALSAADDAALSLAPHIGALAQKLFGDRPDAAQNNVRQQAYEALISVVSTERDDVKTVLVAILPHVLQRFARTFAMPTLSPDDRDTRNSHQTSLCVLVQARDARRVSAPHRARERWRARARGGARARAASARAWVLTRSRDRRC